jgi:gliding motility-associated-like protein
MAFRLLLAALFFIPFRGFSQLTVTAGGTPASIMSALIGGGMTVSNPVINCNATAYGTFNGASSNIGLPNGVLLTSGDVNLAPGPNNQGGAGYCWNFAAGAPDPQLTTVEANAVYDLCVLEFDVVPHCSSMTIRFVFASEEYPEYVSSSVNDAFGFFVTGPSADCSNPFGYNNTNVSVLPSGQGVSIDNINNGNWAGCPTNQSTGPCNNCAYYVNNCSGTTVQYDGFTTPIVVTLNVCPCQTYHWKFAIADAGDCVWDSGVFIDFLQCAAPFSYNVNTTNATCACDGSANINIGTGTPPYTYSWSPIGQTGATASNLCAGTYTVSVTDANSCNIPVVQTFTINSASSLNANTASTNNNCYNQSNGTASVAAAGGNGPYTYTWNSAPVQTTQTATGLPAGTYTVTVTDASGCSVTSTATVTQPTQVTAAGSTVTNISCYNGNNGSATVTPGGGSGIYTYIWSPTAQTGQTATSLSVGPYTVTVTDNNGCSATSTATIIQPPVLTGIGSTLTNVSCFNGNNGSAQVTPGGGTGPYTYLWAPSGQTGQTATSLSSGPYNVTVTDANGCTVSSTATVTQPPVLTGGGSTLTNVSCNGGANGSVKVNPNGGTPGYTYLWSPSGQTGQTATGLSSGPYTVTITDANGCTVSATASVNQPTAVTAAGSNVTNVSCSGGNNGSVMVTPGNGTPGYSYLWSGSGQIGQTATNLAQGTYTVTVTDANGCTVTSTASVTQPTALTATGANVSNVSCNGGNNGSATVTPGNGTPGYSYLWSGSGQTGQTATNLAAGTYTVTVTDANGCTITATASVTQPTAMTAAGANITNVSCNGGNNGSVSVTPGNGTPPYTYLWTSVAQTTQTATGLAAGTYTVTVSDANGCTVTATASVTQPTALAALGANVTNVSCNGGNNGSVTVNPSNGTPGYTYLWSAAAQTGQTATGLAMGTYTVTVTDANGCTITATASVTEPTALAALGSNVTNVSCNGGSDGSVTVAPSNGTPGYSYLWSPSGQTSQTATGLAQGNYQVTVTDANGCTITSTASITEPTLVTANASTLANIACSNANNGVAEVTAGGGTGTYTYLWSPSGGTNATASGLGGGTYTATVTDANGCTMTATTIVNQTNPVVLSIPSTVSVSCNGGSDGQALSSVSGGAGPYSYNWTPSGETVATATGLAIGTYTVTVTDANGCTEIASATITEPPLLTSSIPSSTNASCFGAADGSASVSAAGGTGSYNYIWTPAGGTDATASNLSASSYTVTVTDANGCSTMSSVSITEPVVLTSAISSSINLTCNNDNSGSASVNVNGGTGPYTYSWLPSGETSATASNLAAGTYTIAVADAHGCLTATSTTITEPTAVTSVINGSLNVTCAGGNDGSATVQAGGGTPPYNYNWVPAGGNGPVASNLIAGNYTVTVTDNNGCTSSIDVTITEPSAVTAAITSSTDVSCNGQVDGSAVVAAGGGTGTYNYLWSPAGGIGATASNLFAGTYTVTVTDANNCFQTTTIVITEPIALTAVIPAFTNLTCFNAGDGSASVNASGGTAPYTYSWLSTGGTSATASNLTAGTYTVGVADAHGCLTATSVVITEPAQLTSAITATVDNVCNGGSTGSATVSVNGGTPGYVYQWSPAGGVDSTATNLAAGTYTVNISDANGCTSMQTVDISEPTVLTFFVSPTATICQSQSTTISATASGGSAPYSFAWSNSNTDSSQVVSPTATTIYTVDVTDANGCTAATQSVTVNVYPILNVTPNAPASICENQTATFSALGGGGNGGPYNYTWSNGDTGATIPVVITQDTTLMVTIDDGCSPPVQQSISVVANQVPQVNFGPSYINGCTPLIVDFTDSSTTDAGSMYVWNIGNGATSNQQNFSYTYTTPGVYDISLTVTTPQNCTNSLTMQQVVEVFNLPDADFVTSNPVVDILQPYVDFTNLSTDANTWQWNFGDSTLDSTAFNPSHIYGDTGTYLVMLAVVSDHGCLDTVYRKIKVTTEYALFIPSSFSPNGDGKNDKFYAYGSWITQFEMVILDRWGSVLFRTNDINEPWDGTYQRNGNKCQSDVYVYKITATGPDKRSHQFVGHVTLWR